MTKSNLSSLATFRKTAAVIVATASVLATALTPASAQSPTVPGKPTISSIEVEQGIFRHESRLVCQGLTIRWVSPNDGGSPIIATETRHRSEHRSEQQRSTSAAHLRVDAEGWIYWRNNHPLGAGVRGEYPRAVSFSGGVIHDVDHRPSRAWHEPVHEPLFEFSVREFNSVGAGPWSDIVVYEDLFLTCEDSDDTKNNAGPPTVPLSVSAIPGEGSVTLSWNEPSSDGGSPVTTYEVGYRLAGRHGSYYTRTTAATSIEITGLINEVDYEFFVRARNAHGSSGWTETIIASPVGSEVSPPSVELREIIDFMDLILEPIDYVPPPVEPIVEECPSVAKYETERLGGWLRWWPARKTSFRIVATESWELNDGTRVNRGALGGEVKYEAGSLSRFGCSWAFAGSKIEDSANVYGNAIVKENARVADKAKISGSAVIGGGLGSTFVGGDARVSDNAQVSADARVWGKTRVYDNAKVSFHAQVYGNAKVYDEAKVRGVTEVYGNARVYGEAEVHGDANVYGDAHVYGEAEVYGDAEICGDAKVRGTAVIFQDMKVCEGEYDGDQEYDRAAKEIFKVLYEEYYDALLFCEGGDGRAAHKGALDLASGANPDLETTLENCDRLKTYFKIVEGSAPQGWDFILTAANAVSWPLRVRVVLGVATLVSSLDTLNRTRQEVEDHLGSKKGKDAYNIDSALEMAYKEYVETYKRCSGSFYSSDCLDE